MLLLLCIYLTVVCKYHGSYKRYYSNIAPLGNRLRNDLFAGASARRRLLFCVDSVLFLFCFYAQSHSSMRFEYII